MRILNKLLDKAEIKYSTPIKYALASDIKSKMNIKTLDRTIRTFSKIVTLLTETHAKIAQSV
jgi:hypothetical protein